jgi:hypothetical protein
MQKIHSRILRLLERLTANARWVTSTSNATMVHRHLQVQIKAVTWQVHDSGILYVPEVLFHRFLASISVIPAYL